MRIELNNKHFLAVAGALVVSAFFIMPKFAYADSIVFGSIHNNATWSKQDSPFIVNGSVTVGSGGELVIEPGVIVKLMKSSQILTQDGGSLKAIGTLQQPIVFTSYTDDIGGDSNDDGNDTQPETNYWTRVQSNSASDVISYAEFRYGGFCLDVFGSINITNTKIQHCGRGIFSRPISKITASQNDISFNDTGIYTLGNPDLNLTNNSISENRVGIQVETFGSMTVKNNNIANNGFYGVINFSGTIIDAKNNWWGDASGPLHEKNPDGKGNQVTNDVDFEPWLEDAIEIDEIDPVIIIPGILGSAQKNGTWLIDPILHTYDDLIETLDANGFTPEKDLFTFPYDWRQSNVITARLLEHKINQVKEICECSKVDLVAHSMGGLAARQYVQSERYNDDVDQLIFLGTPHLGAPKAYLSWEGSETDTGFFDQVLKKHLKNEAKDLGFDGVFSYIRRWPIQSIQELLPTYNYILDNDNLLRFYPSDYPVNFFLEKLSDTKSELEANNVKILNIIGNNGENNTINKIKVEKVVHNYLWQHGFPINFGSTNEGLIRGSGDGTVPISSASSMKNSVVVESGHSRLPTDNSGYIFQKLTSKVPIKIIDKIRIPNLLMIKLFSPIDMVIIAPDGKRIGKDLESNKEFNEIDDAFYSGFETDDEYITIPNPMDGEYKIVTKGTDNGGEYTIAVGYIEEDKLIEQEFTGQAAFGLITKFGLQLDSKAEALVIEPKITTQSSLFDLEQAYLLGFIDNVGIVNSLTVKIGKQNYNSAINELNAQRAKHISEKAYQKLIEDINWLNK